jgi:hypothetical protein
MLIFLGDKRECVLNLLGGVLHLQQLGVFLCDAFFQLGDAML